MAMPWNYTSLFLSCLIFTVKGSIFGDEAIGGFKFTEPIKGAIKSKFWNIFFLNVAIIPGIFVTPSKDYHVITS